MTHEDLPKEEETSIAGSLIALPFRLLWGAFVICVPALAAWLLSSLAASAGASMLPAALTGLALFPVIPLVWELLGSWWRRRKGLEVGKFLTFFDRMVLRTLAVSLLALTVLLFAYPQDSFTALQSRGDWMLDGQDTEGAKTARAALFTIADRLEWVYDLTRENPYEEFDDDSTGDIKPAPVAVPIVLPDAKVADKTDAKADAKPDTKPDAPKSPTWPMKAELHPVVTEMPESAKGSLEDAAAYIKANTTGDLSRAKAIHDFVADRVAYDAVALAEGRYPPQDAKTVFDNALGVCAGYAKLATAMGKLAEVEIVYVVGDARTNLDARLDGAGHAWNAVKIDGAWYLMDVTWDAGSVDGRKFTKKYSSENFLTPPHIFGLRHLPDDPAWQLMSEPVSRGEFLRQPMLSSAFYTWGFELETPTRSHSSAWGVAKVVVKNPGNKSLIATVTGGGVKKKCKVSGSDTFQVTCDLPKNGSYDVLLFGANERYTTHWSIGSLRFDNRL